ncbi:MAG: NAD(P)H-binding protein [Actinobacteria bacterium]|nr:NAD(P)H-binding protein [Actinomycetota bacterium]
MKVLVTGGTGFVGPKIVNALVDANHWVRVLERGPGSWKQAGLRCQEAVEGDVTDAESMRSAAAGCEAVVHLVALLNGSPRDFERVMEEGTRNVIAAAQEAGAARRFVLMSALGTSEQTKDLVPYYRAKWTMEQDVKASGLEHVIFRPSFVFGRDGGSLQQFRRIARLAPVTPIVGPGTQRIQPIWVDDVAAYFAASLEQPEAANRTFELGGPDVVTWNEFWARLKRAMGARRPTVHLPVGLMRMQAAVLERLPRPPVTRDQLTMLEAGDNVVGNDDAVHTFGLPLVPLDDQLRRAV